MLATHSNGANRASTVRARSVLLAVVALAASLIGPARGQRVEYCSGDGQSAVIFLSDDTGTFSDGAVDTGMGVYKPHTDCKWVIKPVINEQVPLSVALLFLTNLFVCFSCKTTAHALMGAATISPGPSFAARPNKPPRRPSLRVPQHRGWIRLFNGEITGTKATLGLSDFRIVIDARHSLNRRYTKRMRPANYWGSSQAAHYRQVSSHKSTRCSSG